MERHTCGVSIGFDWLGIILDTGGISNRSSMELQTCGFSIGFDWLGIGIILVDIVSAALKSK